MIPAAAPAQRAFARWFNPVTITAQLEEGITELLGEIAAAGYEAVSHSVSFPPDGSQVVIVVARLVTPSG